MFGKPIKKTFWDPRFSLEEISVQLVDNDTVAFSRTVFDFTTRKQKVEVAECPLNDLIEISKLFHPLDMRDGDTITVKKITITKVKESNTVSHLLDLFIGEMKIIIQICVLQSILNIINQYVEEEAQKVDPFFEELEKNRRNTWILKDPRIPWILKNPRDPWILKTPRDTWIFNENKKDIKSYHILRETTTDTKTSDVSVSF